MRKSVINMLEEMSCDWVERIFDSCDIDADISDEEEMDAKFGKGESLRVLKYIARVKTIEGEKNEFQEEARKMVKELNE